MKSAYFFLLLLCVSCNTNVASRNKKEINNNVEDTILSPGITYSKSFKTLTIRNFFGDTLTQSLVGTPIDNIEIYDSNKLYYDDFFELLANNGIQKISFNNTDCDISKIRYLKNLTSIKFENCNIRNLDSIIYVVGLSNIEMSFNGIKYFPSCLLNLLSIRQITMNESNITQLDIHVSNWKKLKYLNLENSGISSLPNSIIYCDSLNELWLGNTPLAKKIIKHIKSTKQNVFHISDYGEIQFIKNRFPRCVIHLYLKPVGQDNYAS